jgi:hypothetical protein
VASPFSPVSALLLGPSLSQNMSADMRTVYKYMVMNFRGEHKRMLMPDYEVVHVGAQEGNIYIWAIVDPDAPVSLAFFQVVGTGHPVPKGKHVGSVQDNGFVWHVFDVGNT